jgi:hypothetical protein
MKTSDFMALQCANNQLPIPNNARLPLEPRKSSCMGAATKPCSLRGLGRCDARARCTASLCRLARRSSSEIMGFMAL